jgi:hypothetical protein
MAPAPMDFQPPLRGITGLRGLVETCQPTTMRENTSRTDAAQTHPVWVRM